MKYLVLATVALVLITANKPDAAPIQTPAVEWDIERLPEVLPPLPDTTEETEEVRYECGPNGCRLVAPDRLSLGSGQVGSPPRVAVKARTRAGLFRRLRCRR